MIADLGSSDFEISFGAISTANHKIQQSQNQQYCTLIFAFLCGSKT